jgi:SAM-dependent methyltransferase
MIQSRYDYYREIIGGAVMKANNREDIVIKMENTAIANGQAKSVKEVAKLCDKDIEVLDYGTGRMRNAQYLLENGFNNVSVLDRDIVLDKFGKGELDRFKAFYSDKEIPQCRFDLILCNYVLNVVPDIESRHNILKNILNLLKPSGVALIEVRKDKDIFKNAKHYEAFGDGLVMGAGKIRTFQRPYSVGEFEDILKGFNFRIIKQIKGTGSIAFLVGRNIVSSVNIA